MRVEYDPSKDIPHHVPADLPEHIQQQLDKQFHAARRKTLEQARIEHDLLHTKYIPNQIEHSESETR